MLRRVQLLYLLKSGLVRTAGAAASAVGLSPTYARKLVRDYEKDGLDALLAERPAPKTPPAYAKQEDLDALKTAINAGKVRSSPKHVNISTWNANSPIEATARYTTCYAVTRCSLRHSAVAVIDDRRTATLTPPFPHLRGGAGTVCGSTPLAPLMAVESAVGALWRDLSDAGYIRLGPPILPTIPVARSVGNRAPFRSTYPGQLEASSP